MLSSLVDPKDSRDAGKALFYNEGIRLATASMRVAPVPSTLGEFTTPVLVSTGRRLASGGPSRLM